MKRSIFRLHFNHIAYMVTSAVKSTQVKRLGTAILLILFNFINPVKSYCQATLPANFNDALVMGGWTNVEGFQFDALNRMYVWEKAGKVWIVDSNNVKLAAPLIDISEEVGDWRDHGLNGFALDPNFNTNGYYYLMYTVDRHYLLKYGTAQYNSATNEYFNATIIRVTRYTANPASNFTTTISGSRLVLIGETKKTGIPLLHESHSGGSLVFGTDGSLLISTGDGASYNVADGGSSSDTYWSQGLTDSIIRTKENVGAFRAQLVDCLNGKVLRINPANGDGLPTNPFYDSANPRAAKSRVWSLGLRNPFRMVLRPNSGSTDITAGDPGVLYIGDVQWSTWEDLNVADTPGQNFGWPTYEGLTSQGGYQALTSQNMDAPNPLYGTGGCTQQYFRFTQLINQDTIGTPLWKNPCNTSQTIPAAIPKFIHTRPAVDWAHGNQSRTGIYSGTSATAVNLYSGSSPVPGPQFGGNASVGGVWYTGNKYPLQYQNKYFHADYGGAWIKVFDFNSLNKPMSVTNFGSNMGAVVFVGMNPKTKEIYYVKYSDQIRKITYSLSVNNPPVAVASQNIIYGASPLPVIFTGSASSDPEGQILTYAWNFGDGGTSNQSNPSHTFSASIGTPTTYPVTLTVTDNVGQTSIATLKVYVNNTPPQVTITSFNNGDLFTVAHPTNLPLQASVTDLEHTPNQLTYKWITSLHHNNHTHPENPDTSKITSAYLTPVNCDDSLNTFSYDIQLTVTDAGGLATTVQQTVYPACAAPVANFIADKLSICEGSNINFTDYSLNLPDSYSWSFPGGNPSTSTSKNPMVIYSTPGVYNVSLLVTSTRGTNMLQKTGYIVVNAMPVVNAGTYSPVCINSGLMQLAGLPFGGTYSGNGITNGTFDPSIGSGNHSISYSYTDPNGCSNSSSTNIIVNGLPFADAGIYNAVCENGSVVNLVGTPSGGIFSGNGVSGNVFNPGVSLVGTQTITYSYTDANGCSNSAFSSILVNQSPTVSAGIYSPVCINGGDVSLNGIPSGGIFSGNGVIGNIFNPGVAGAGSQLITYSYNDANGCGNSSSTNITVNPLPNVLAGNYVPVCQNGNNITLIGSPTNGIFSGTGVSGNIFTPAIGPGNYIINYSFTDGNGCTNSDTALITVNNCNCATPLQPGGITTTRGSSKVCPGESRTYTVVFKPGVIYNWVVPVGATINNGQGSNSINVSFNPLFTQLTTDISVTANNSCGTSPVRTTSITRNNPVTPASIAGLLNGVCNLNNVSYSTPNVSGIAYNWYFSTTKGNVISGQTSSAITANFTNGFTTVNLSVTANNNCGTSAPRTIIIKPTPETPSSISGTSSPCINQVGVPYSISPVSYATKYLWTAPSGSHITDGIINGGVTLTTSSNIVSINFGNVAAKVICNAGNVCGYGSQSALNINFGCREAELNSDNKVSENLSDGSISVYPNPSKGKVIVEYFTESSKEVTLKIQNIIGQIKMTQDITSEKGINKVSFDFSNYPKGVYLLEWSDNHVQHYAKIVMN